MSSVQFTQKSHHGICGSDNLSSRAPSDKWDVLNLFKIPSCLKNEQPQPVIFGCQRSFGPDCMPVTVQNHCNHTHGRELCRAVILVLCERAAHCAPLSITWTLC